MVIKGRKQKAESRKQKAEMLRFARHFGVVLGVAATFLPSSFCLLPSAFCLLPFPVSV
jgi:hypothetical protein